MSQFEYNDLNKFFVSVGVFLIGLTFLLPWLYLRENFNLLITEDNLNTLTTISRDVIEKRQTIVSVLSYIIPTISIGSFGYGIYLFFKGIKGWKKLQSINEEREELKKTGEQLANQKLTLEIQALSLSEKTNSQMFVFDRKAENESEMIGMGDVKAEVIHLPEIESIKIPINYKTWKVNHWGSDVATIENGKMIFKGKTRLATDGSHIDLKDALKIGSNYKVSCFVKALPKTTGQFQLWCHDNIEIGRIPTGAESAVPYAPASTEGAPCTLTFEAKNNPDIRIHFQYSPGDGQIEVSDLRIGELPS